MNPKFRQSFFYLEKLRYYRFKRIIGYKVLRAAKIILNEIKSVNQTRFSIGSKQRAYGKKHGTWVKIAKGNCLYKEIIRINWSSIGKINHETSDGKFS